MLRILNNAKLQLNRLIVLFKDREGLIGRSIQSGGFLAVGGFVDTVLRFVRNIILARLLTPDAFGLIWTIAAIIFIAEAISEVGLTTSVIQNKKGADIEFVNVIWWLSALRGLVLYVIAYLASPLICSFLNMSSQTVIILQVAFTVFLFKGFISPNFHLLQKELNFKKWVLVTLVAASSGIFAAIILGFLLRSVWALVLGIIIESFMTFVLSHIFFTFIPKFQFNRLYAIEISRFSRKIFGLPILMVIYAQADNFVIGKVLSLGALGMYGLAKDVADMPNKIFAKISPVFLPAFSLLQDDQQKLKKTLLQVTEAFATFGLPLFTFSIIFSKQILSLVYTAEYGVIAIPYSIFSLYVFIYICSVLIMNAFLAIGQPDKHRIASIARVICYLAILYPATEYYGLIGVAFSALISMIVSFAIQTHYLKRLININISEYLTRFLKGTKHSFIVLIPGIIFNSLLPVYEISAVIFGAFLCIIAWSVSITQLSLVK